MNRFYRVMTLLLAGTACAQAGANAAPPPVEFISAPLFHLASILTWAVMCIAFWGAALREAVIGLLSLLAKDRT